MMLAWQWPKVSILCLSFVAIVIWYRHHRSDEQVLWQAHEHASAKRSDMYAWRDCTGRAPAGMELKRAYRRLALQAHPDKGGVEGQFEALSIAHKQLQSPVQYNLRAAFVSGGEEGHGVQDARLEVSSGKDGPRLRLEVDFTSPAERGYWKFGLMAKGVSAIEYSGDGHGYDVCCQFLKDSHCVYKPYSELVQQHAAHQDGAWDSMYKLHDCPLKPETVYTGVVDKPLHTAADGLWAAVLELVDPEGKELACAAVTFRVEGEQLRALSETTLQL